MVGEYIAWKRRLLGLTQQDLSDRLKEHGIDRAVTAISGWETGYQQVPLDVIPAIAASLEEQSPVALYKLAGVLSNLPGSKIVELLDGLPEHEIRKIERIIATMLEKDDREG